VDHCETKTNGANKQSVIDYLKYLMLDMNLKKKDSKKTTYCITSLNKDLKELKE
jgi:hypothetical protein